jgi:2'-5' RNA ligase
MFYVLCYPKLVSADSEWIETFRRIHERGRAELVRAHVTLVFGVCSIEIGVLTSLAAEIASNEAAFDVAFDRVDLHEDRARAVYKLLLVASEGAERIARLHRQFYSGVLRPELWADVPFQAHMTLATASSLDSIQDAWQQAQNLRLPIRGTIDAIDVAALVDRQLSSVSRVLLGG